MKRLKFCLLYLAVFLLLLGTVGCSEDDDPDTMFYPDTLTIATYNVEDFAYGVEKKVGETPNSYDGIAQLLLAEGVGIVCLQEAQAGSLVNDTYADGSIASQGDVTEFNRAIDKVGLGMRYWAFSVDGGSRKDYIAVWSKYKIDSVTSVKPDRMVDPVSHKVFGGYRPILRFRVKYRGKDVWFYNMHLKSNAGGIVEDNMARRRAQAFHLYLYIMRNHDPENDLIVLLGDMNTMEADYSSLGGTTIDFLSFRFDNPSNPYNDFVPVNLKHLGAITNWLEPGISGQTPGTTHPGDEGGYPDATFDHIILSPTLYNNYYVPDSIRIIKKWDGGSTGDGTQGYADHCPVILQLQFTNN